jgi:hypothetical protein
MKSAGPDAEAKAERVREYCRGAQLIFDNAESLFKEAAALKQAGTKTARACMPSVRWLLADKRHANRR